MVCEGVALEADQSVQITGVKQNPCSDYMPKKTKNDVTERVTKLSIYDEVLATR